MRHNFQGVIPDSATIPVKNFSITSFKYIFLLNIYIHTHIYTYTYYNYWYSALGPVWADTRAQSGDWYGSGTLHPGQVLRGSLPLLSPAF